MLTTYLQLDFNPHVRADNFSFLKLLSLKNILFFDFFVTKLMHYVIQKA